MPSDTDFRRPELPALLTKAHWDKKKGTIAKMAGSTGMGAALAKVEKAYKGVNWDTLEMTLNKPKPFHLKAWDKMQADAVKEMKGGLAKLRAECFAARDVAKQTEAEFKKKKTIPKSSVQLCADIAQAADFMGVGANANSMGTRIEKMYAFGRKATDFTADGILKKAPAKVAVALKSLEVVKRNPTHATWKSEVMMTRARDVNQYIGNVGKLIDMGYPFKLNRANCDKVFKAIQLYASKDVPFAEDADAKEVLGHVAKLTAGMKLAEAVLQTK